MPIFCVNNDGSPSFFDTRVVHDIPEGAIEISESLHAQLMDDQSNGLVLLCDGNGPYSSRPAPPEMDLETLKATGLDRLQNTVQRFMQVKPDRSARYDNTLMSAIILFLVEHGVTAQPAAAAKAWASAVQKAYLERAATIIGSTDRELISAVISEATYQWFEDRYGETGSVLPDPNVTLYSLWTAGQQS